MAYRELGVIELQEVWRRYSQGKGLRGIARSLGADRKTIAKIVAAGAAVGLQRGVTPPTEAQLGQLAAHWRARPVGRSAALPDRLAPYQPQSQAWLADGLRLTKIHAGSASKASPSPTARSIALPRRTAASAPRP